MFHDDSVFWKYSSSIHRFRFLFFCFSGRGRGRNLTGNFCVSFLGNFSRNTRINHVTHGKTNSEKESKRKSYPMALSTTTTLKRSRSRMAERGISWSDGWEEIVKCPACKLSIDKVYTRMYYYPHYDMEIPTCFQCIKNFEVEYLAEQKFMCTVCGEVGSIIPYSTGSRRHLKNPKTQARHHAPVCLKCQVFIFEVPGFNGTK